ncbi:AAA family ATPase [Segatella copri]|uniref:AAA family ATPase n=1 Tax=Segatella copri TaxID=165179 RepID=A0AAW9TH59_9BACT|nr:AAA family ATPase [Segatella copri]MQN27310.1 AAA family ATPase [Segatella copri]MQN32178.1 AAA family ATPase [Segatella copri]MQN37065.1 AAA family ATPase [Segatella copri]MQN74384.1 AAA family ATPase [Segatella copri]MQO26006.1 AAA family ATPase [Segatella copri]
MKFLQLEILNLASLDKQGGEVINFEEGALGESTIFSIVGPTGSGKSTLLDAICLALYNRAPRYPRKKGDKNQNIEIFGAADASESNRLAPTDSRNILTRGKKEGYSKLTFLANNGSIYRAEWHVRFQRVRYENAKTALYKITRKGEEITEEAADWNELPNIIGLDYDQFLRTVLIAQGSFANFLTAKENERYELLEKLIGCEETYTNIATEIKKAKDQATDDYNQMAASVEAVKQNLLNDEELAHLKEEIARLEKAEKELDSQLQAISKDLQWFEENDKQIKQITICQSDMKQAADAIKAMQAQILRLQLHDEVQPAVNLLQEVERQTQSIHEQEENIQKAEGNIKSQESAISESEKTLASLKEAVSKAQEQLEKALPVIAEARALKTKIEAAMPNLTEKKEALELAQKENQSALKDVEENARNIKKWEAETEKANLALKATKEEIAKQKQVLHEATQAAEHAWETERNKTAGQNIEELQNSKTVADRKLQDVQQAIKVVAHLDAATTEKQKNEERILVLGKRNAEIDEALGKLTIEALTQETLTLRNAYTLMVSEKWEIHRANLTEGKPCPLCGSTTHPYHTDNRQFEEATTELSQLLKVKEDLLKQEQIQEKNLSGERKQNDGEVQTLQKQQEKLSGEIASYEEEWKALIAQYPKIPKAGTELKALLPIYENKAKDASSKLSLFNKIQKEIERLTQLKDKAVKDEAAYESKASTIQNKAQENTSICTTKLAEQKALTTNLISQQKSKEEAYVKALQTWNSTKKEMEEWQEKYKQILNGEEPDAAEQRLTAAKDEATKAADNQNENINKLKAELANSKGSHQTMLYQNKTMKENLQAKEKELDLWIEEYNKQLEEKSIEGKDFEETDSKEKGIEERSLESRFIDRNIIGEMLHSAEDWNAIRRAKDEKEKAVASTTALYQSAEKAHQQHLEHQPAKSRDALLAIQQEYQERSQRNELIAAKARMQNHQEAVKQLGDKAEALQLVTQEKDDWTAITDAIGADGKTLRKIAQCYTLSFLIAHANQEIRKFNSRYELQQVKHSLGIRVIDHDRADDIRDTTSLSGGETFIVSLGLALGLSALSSRNISFENLFIDEGFGTLDPDTLATVIDSLAMLQSSQGKKVGVISHTDTMSERITTQIRIIKNGNSGSSHIEIYP